MNQKKLLNIVLNYLWIEKYGINGAAYSTLVCYALFATCNFIAAFIYRKHTLEEKCEEKGNNA